MNTDIANQIETIIIRWAKNHANLRAVVVMGSQARSEHPADEWSDLDLLFLITKYMNQDEADEWIKEICFELRGVWSSASEPISNSEWFPLGNIVLDRFKVDIVCAVIANEAFQLSDLETTLPKLPYAYVFYPSCKILYDLIGRPRTILIANGRYILNIPDEVRLVNNFRFFWMELVHLAQVYNRGEHWRAVILQNQCLEKYLLRLIEWHSLLFLEGERIWPRGRFLEEWADSRIVLELQDLQIVFKGNAFWTSIFKLYNLHRWLALEICKKKEFVFPTDEANTFLNWLKDLSFSFNNS
jgi:aminoglycoside 6-adenylyltransferase